MSLETLRTKRDKLRVEINRKRSLLRAVCQAIEQEMAGAPKIRKRQRLSEKQWSIMEAAKNRIMERIIAKTEAEPILEKLKAAEPNP